MNKKKVVIIVAIFLIALVLVFVVRGKNKGNISNSEEKEETLSLKETIDKNAKENPKDFRGYTYAEYADMVEELYIKAEDFTPAKVVSSYKDKVFTIELYNEEGEIVEYYTVDKETGNATSNLGRKINFELGEIYEEYENVSGN